MGYWKWSALGSGTEIVAPLIVESLNKPCGIPKPHLAYNLPPPPSLCIHLVLVITVIVVNFKYHGALTVYILELHPLCFLSMFIGNLPLTPSTCCMLHEYGCLLYSRALWTSHWKVAVGVVQTMDIIYISTSAGSCIALESWAKGTVSHSAQAHDST